MLAVDKKVLHFKLREMYFCDEPFETKDCDRVTFVRCPKKVDLEGFTRTERHTSIIDLTQDLDAIWSNMSRGNCRKPIKRAERAGVTVRMNGGYPEFYEMYLAVKKEKGVSGVALSLEEIQRLSTLFVAEQDGEIISGHGYVEDEAHINSWVIGSKRFEDAPERVTMVGNASKLIVWEVIKYAKTKGIKHFDMGEIWSEEDAASDPVKRNINFFKKSFGGETVECYTYEKTNSKTAKAARYLVGLANRAISGRDQ